MQVVRSLLIVVVLLHAGAVLADVVSAKGKATIKYSEGVAGPETRANALLAAQMNAIDFYYAEAGDAQAENLDAIRPKIKENLERYVLETTVLNEEDRSDLHQYTIVVRLSLNASNLRNALKATTMRTASGERSQLVFIFVARQVATQTTFDRREYTRVDRREGISHKGEEGESIRRAKVSTYDSANADSSSAVEKGGSVTQKSAEVSWRIVPTQDLSQIVTQIFKTAGYRVAEAQFVEPMTGGKLKVAAIESDYTSGNDLKSQTLQGIVTGLRTAQVRFFALGTLDVSVADVDPVTGLRRVVVTVNSKIIDVAQSIPESVAVAGPAQYAGTGPTDDEARVNALKLAAQNAARELTSQLANAGLQ